jgi:hypothetical protein
MRNFLQQKQSAMIAILMKRKQLFSNINRIHNMESILIVVESVNDDFSGAYNNLEFNKEK